MRRRAGFLFILGAAVPFLVLASAAWACGVLATLKAAPSTAAPGQAVSVTGTNYSSNAAFTAVQVRLDSRTGPVLGEVRPNADGRIDTTINVPAGAGNGDHLVIATQNRLSDGTPKTGTPGRSLMRVEGASAGSSAAPASPWGDSGTGGSGGSGAPAPSPLVASLLSLAMLGVGVTLVGRDRRARRGSALGAA